jgi:hypothetical protein
MQPSGRSPRPSASLPVGSTACSNGVDQDARNAVPSGPRRGPAVLRTPNNGPTLPSRGSRRKKRAGGSRRAGCCTRRTPTSLRSTGAVTVCRAAVSSTHRPHRPHHPPRPGRAFVDRPSSIVSADPRFVKTTKTGNVGSRRSAAQPVRAGQPPQCTDGWCGSVCSPDARPAPRARRGSKHGRRRSVSNGGTTSTSRRLSR